jgi:hypothetical protein
MRPVDTSLSPYEQMQAWRDKRASALDSFSQQNDQLTGALSGATDAFSAMMGTNTGSGYFISNDVMSSAIFSAVSNTDAEETLMANIIYTRVAKENAAKSSQQQSALDDLQSSLAGLSSGGVDTTA